jgi:hypothetical protein
MLSMAKFAHYIGSTKLPAPRVPDRKKTQTIRIATEHDFGAGPQLAGQTLVVNYGSDGIASDGERAIESAGINDKGITESDGVVKEERTTLYGSVAGDYAVAILRTVRGIAEPIDTDGPAD